MALLVQISYVNATKGHRIGDDPEESVDMTRGELYRRCLAEFGRCASKMYVDVKGGKTRESGWVFEGRDKYTDSPDTYIREVWVHVREES